MAVTLNESDLILPAGELSNHFFPQGDMDTQLSGWLFAATAKVEGDSNITTANHNDAAAAYVYYLAYSYIGRQMRSLPSRHAEGDGAIDVSYQLSQGRDWFADAAAKLTDYGSYRSANSLVGTHFALAHGQRGR